MITKNLSFAEYRALPGLSISAFKNMRKSALHFKYFRDHPAADTAAKALGRATHTAILEPQRFLADYVLWEGGSRSGKKWTEFAKASADAGTKQILTRAEYATACAMRDAVRGNPHAMRYLTTGDAEVSLQFERDGVACKCRVDWITRLHDEPILVGLKTAKDAGARAFSRQAVNLGYHVQWDWYNSGYKATTGESPVEMVEIVVENTPPHDVAVYRPSPQALFLGKKTNEELLEKYKACLDSNLWPGEQPGETELTLPNWAFFENEEGADFAGVDNG